MNKMEKDAMNVRSIIGNAAPSSRGAPLILRLMSKWCGGLSECWYWRGRLNEDGYGSYKTVEFGTMLVHRLAWILWFGEIPKGKQVLHSCDVRCCFNPDHLISEIILKT